MLTSVLTLRIIILVVAFLAAIITLVLSFRFIDRQAEKKMQEFDKRMQEFVQRLDKKLDELERIHEGKGDS